jgi:hypothetical protein
MTTLGGIVVPDTDWQEYSASVEAAGGSSIRVRFEGERSDTRILRDPSGGGGLVCLRGRSTEIIPLIPYSQVACDPDTTPASASAEFMQRLIASGLPQDLAVYLTNQLYRNRSHDLPVPDVIVNRLIERWRNGGFTSV